MWHHLAKALLLLCLFFLLTAWSNADNLINPDTTKGLSESVSSESAKIDAYQKLNSLPIELTPEEMTRLNEIGIGHKNTAPPMGPPRNPAEWEPMTGALIRWPLGISVSLIKEISEDMEVWTILANSSEQTSATTAYQNAGVNMSNVHFIIARTNSYWTRDYGPWFIFDRDGNQGIVDHIYNRPRPQDDSIPMVIGNLWGIPVYGMDLNTTGGNHMSDGWGTSMSTDLVYDENPGKTHAQVDSIMEAYLGNDYLVMDDVESSGIHHIDCWAKLLDPTTILVKSVSSSTPSYAALNQRASFLATQTSAWGRPYTVVRVFCPSNAAYTNSIILNHKVFVPIISNPSYDTTALRVYREAMPGYEVLGFTGSWLADDAIHCRIMGITDRYMLVLDHIPLYDTLDWDQDYFVSVKITDHSKTGLIPESLLVYYKVNSEPFDTVHLQPTVKADSFYAYIPSQLPGAKVSYFIKAADNSGRVETHPPIGALSAHVFFTAGNTPPQIVSADSLVCAGGDTFRYYPGIYDPDDSVHIITYSEYPSWCWVQNDSLWGGVPDTSSVQSFIVIASDPFHADTQTVNLYTYICGDANWDQNVDVGDVIHLINYLYKSGPPPLPVESGDCTKDGHVDVGDVVYLINYLFKSGSPPCRM
jgi:agmatine/peptidylarginine deiminase